MLGELLPADEITFFFLERIYLLFIVRTPSQRINKLLPCISTKSEWHRVSGEVNIVNLSAKVLILSYQKIEERKKHKRQKQPSHVIDSHFKWSVHTGGRKRMSLSQKMLVLLTITFPLCCSLILTLSPPSHSR